jgi:hypothetical protein
VRTRLCHNWYASRRRPCRWKRFSASAAKGSQGEAQNWDSEAIQRQRIADCVGFAFRFFSEAGIGPRSSCSMRKRAGRGRPVQLRKFRLICSTRRAISSPLQRPRASSVRTRPKPGGSPNGASRQYAGCAFLRGGLSRTGRCKFRRLWRPRSPRHPLPWRSRLVYRRWRRSRWSGPSERVVFAGHPLTPEVLH